MERKKKLSRPSKVSEKGDCPQGSLTGHVSPVFNFLVGSRIRFVGNFLEVLVLRYTIYHKSCPIHPRLHQVYHSAAPAGALSR